MSNFSNLYDRKYLFRYLFVMALMFAIMKITSGAGFGLAILFALGSLAGRKTESLFFWLVFSVCTIIANGYIVVKGVAYSFEQRIMMVLLGGCMAAGVFGTRKNPVLRPYLIMFAYIAFMFLPSAIGWAPMISFLKLILFTLIYFAYFGVANRVATDTHCSSIKIRSIMLAFAIFFIFGSMALLPFPGISQLKAEDYQAALDAGVQLTSLFAGMTTHSQCLGPVIALLAIILFGDMLFSIKKTDPLYMGLLACCPYLIYKTSSRTGMGAFLLGMMFVFYYFMKARGISSRWRSRMFSLMMMLGMVLAIAIMASGSGGIRKFATKSTDSSKTLTAENVIRTRQGKFDEGIANFKESPLIGNGFQVAKDMDKRGWGYSIMSAPIEKGVWVSAVLEEGGIIGWSIFVIFLCSAIFGSIRRKAYISAGCLVTFSLLNMGEFTFFSMSYTGGFCWAMVFAAITLDVRRISEQSLLRNCSFPGYQVNHG